MKPSDQEANICPVCGSEAEIRCRCFRCDRTCANGHSWHLCEVHGKKVLGESDHGKRGCSCPPEGGSVGLHAMVALREECESQRKQIAELQEDLNIYRPHVQTIYIDPLLAWLGSLPKSTGTIVGYKDGKLDHLTAMRELIRRATFPRS